MKLELKGITKRFGPLVANNDINLTIEEGHIHALLGENGAGKSTLMNVLYGLHQPDEGEILIDGKPVHFNGPGDAVAAGIGMVHQHFMLIPVFTVAESIALGFEPTKASGLIDLAQARRTVEEVSARFGFDLDPDALIEDLSVGAQQRVEIVKALSRQAKVLILDEPTAVLTPQETDELMAIMRQLADAGTSIVFITHKLREVRAVADEITVIRRGTVVGEASPQDSESELANKMVGRSVMMRVDKAEAHPSGGGLEFKEISMLSPSSHGDKLACAPCAPFASGELNATIAFPHELRHVAALSDQRIRIRSDVITRSLDTSFHERAHDDEQEKRNHNENYDLRNEATTEKCGNRRSNGSNGEHQEHESNAENFNDSKE